MITIRKSEDRGVADHGWLNSQHTFSFSNYYDPNYMGFGPLRVINEDYIKPGKGFPTHGHRDMEIITYVLEGELEHKDTLGTGSIIRPGEVQRMTAGSGIRHSEYNPSNDHEVHLLQIWLLPSELNLEPSYEQKAFSEEDLTNNLHLIASQSGQDNSIQIHQDVNLYAGKLEAGQTVDYKINKDRLIWLQIAAGKLLLNNEALNTGDGVAIQNETEIKLIAKDNSEILLFDMAGQ